MQYGQERTTFANILAQNCKTRYNIRGVPGEHHVRSQKVLSAKRCDSKKIHTVYALIESKNYKERKKYGYDKKEPSKDCRL